MVCYKEIVVVAIAVVTMVTAETEHHSFETRYGPGTVAIEDIEIDRGLQYMEVTVKPITGNLIATDNFHDFSAEIGTVDQDQNAVSHQGLRYSHKGYTAIRDDERDTCFILKTEHTLAEMFQTFQQSVERKGYFDIQQRFKCINKRFIDSSDLHLYGHRIADFCENHEIVFAEKKFIQRSKRNVNMLVGRSMYCGVCLFSCF